jgi:hypothetical protein
VAARRTRGRAGGVDALPFSPLGHAAFAVLGAVPAVVVGLRLIRRSRAEAAITS